MDDETSAQGSIPRPSTSDHDIDRQRLALDLLAEGSRSAAERERLLASERAARSRAEALQQLTAAFARAGTVAEVVTAAVEQGKRTVGSHAGAVALLDETGTTFTLVAGPGITPDVAATWASYPNAGDGPVPRAVRTARPVYSRTRAEYAASGPGFAEVAEQLDISAEASMPLTVAGAVLGALSFVFNAPREFSADDDVLLRAVADQCAQALERVRLLAAERTAREQTERLQLLTAALSQALTPDDVVEVAVQQGLRALGGDAGLVMLCGEPASPSENGSCADDGLRLAKSLGYPIGHSTAWGHIPVDAPIPVAVAVRERRTVVLRSPEERAERFPMVAEPLAPFAASVALPLTGHGRVIGALAVNWRVAGDLGARSIAFMEAFAWQCGQALERARLHEAAERARRAAEAAAAALEETRRSRDAALLAGEIGTFAWDTVRQRASGDANFGRMFGIALDADGQAPLDRYIDVIHPDDRDRMRAMVLRTVQGGADYEIEYRVMRDDGTVRWLLVRAKPERDETGRIVRAPGVCLDVTGRKEAEDALHRSTTLLQAISDATGDVIYAKDREGRLTYGNPATFALIGRPSEEVIGRTDADVLADQGAAHRVMENDRRVMSAGRAEEVEEIVPLPDGTHRVWASYKMPYRDAYGSVIGLLGVSRDITARTEAERALARQRALLGAILDQLPIGICIAKVPSGSIAYMNRAGARLLGYTASAITAVDGYAALGALHDDGSAYAADEYPLARALAGETLVDHAIRYRRGDGSFVVLSASAAPVYDDAGRLVRAVATWSDVTERIALEDALRDARQRLESILLSIDDGLIVIDREWRYTYFSERAAEITGAQREAMLGNVVWELFPHARGTEFYEGYHRAMETGQPVHFEEFYPDPMNKWLECHCYPGPEGLTVFFRDVTDRKAADVERERLLVVAEEANRAKSVFLANMSHELRTPLNAIGGHVQLIELGVHGDVTPPQAEALGRVQRAQRHLLSLINDVLNYAKLEAGKVEFDVKPTRVADVVNEVVPLLEPLVRTRGLALNLAMPAGSAADVMVWADREKLAQALLNLLENAMKFTPSQQQASGEQGRITVTLDASDASRFVLLRVHDTGIGIAADKLEAIFDPFVQVSAGPSRTHEGTGLGLAISRDVARGMGGDLTVESVPGGGSTFTLALPRVD